MKKMKSLLAVVLAVCIFAGCSPVSDDNSGAADASQSNITDIAEIKENIEEYFGPMNIALGIEWNKNGGQLLEKPIFFKAMLEDIYRFRTNEDFPHENGSVSVDTYVDIANWNFPFDKADVRKALENSYGYNQEDDTVYMSDGLGNVRTSEITDIKMVGENTLMVTYRYGTKDDYNEEDGKWYFSDFKTWVMLVGIEADGYTFLSNHERNTQTISVSHKNIMLVTDNKNIAVSNAGMVPVTDDELISEIEYMYNMSSILMGHSWDVSDGMVTFEGMAILGFNDSLLNFHHAQTGESMAGVVNGEYRMHIRHCIARAAKYFPFSAQTLRRYYTSHDSYDRESDTVIAPDGYGNVCRAELQQLYTDGEYYVAEYHYIWPEEGYDIGRTLLKKDKNGSLIFLANEIER